MCLICDRIEMIKNGTNPYFVKELETGYVVIGDNQHFYGYSLFLYKNHDYTELFQLDMEERTKFLQEMSIVAEDGHNGVGPVWSMPFSEIYADENRPSKEELDMMKSKLLTELEQLLNQ